MTRHAMRARRQAAQRAAADDAPNGTPNAATASRELLLGAPAPRALAAAAGEPAAAVTDAATLAAALERTADALSRLTDDPRYTPEEQRDFALRADDLRRQMTALDAAAFKANTAQYQAAGAALADVNRALGDAAGRIENVTEFFGLVARVAGAVGTIVGAVG